MHALCAEEFTGSRMCTVREIAESPDASALSDTFLGWALGDLRVTATPDSIFSPFLIVETTSGLSYEDDLAGASRLNCLAFMNAGSNGVGIVTLRRRVTTRLCSETGPIQCCAPKLLGPVP